MNKRLTYSDSQDQKLYLHTHETLGSENIFITACTVASNKDQPNEDAFAVALNGNVLFAAVFDGCTSLKPIPALGKQTGARYASHFLRDYFTPADSSVSARSLVSTLNNELLAANNKIGGTLEDIHTLASSTGTVVRIDKVNNSIEIAHVGDSFCVVYYRDGHSELVTIDRNKQFDDHMLAMLADIARERGVTPREAREDERVKQALIQMFIKKFNTPDGSGTGYINGDPHMEQYVQSFTIPLDRIGAILLGSDGLLPQGWSLNNEEDRQAVLREINTHGFEGLIEKKKKSEDDDPNWNNIRYKHSDDATGCLLNYSISLL